MVFMLLVIPKRHFTEDRAWPLTTPRTRPTYNSTTGSGSRLQTTDSARLLRLTLWTLTDESSRGTGGRRRHCIGWPARLLGAARSLRGHGAAEGRAGRARWAGSGYGCCSGCLYRQWPAFFLQGRSFKIQLYQQLLGPLAKLEDQTDGDVIEPLPSKIAPPDNNMAGDNAKPLQFLRAFIYSGAGPVMSSRKQSAPCDRLNYRLLVDPVKTKFTI